MQELFARPIFAAGLLLVVVGIGNQLVARNKLADYTRRLEATPSVETFGPTEDLPLLSPEMGAALVERLHRRAGTYSITRAKLDFYHIVDLGGRAFTLLGVLLAAIAVARFWHGRRPPSSNATVTARS